MTLEIRTIVAGVGDTATITQTVTGTKTTDIVDTIAGEASDVELALVVDITKCNGFFMVATGALTIETNSSSAPDDTITLAANAPLMWIAGNPGAVCPFQGDVTKIFATNEASTAATLTIKMIEVAKV